jgi:hypothetical protein
MESAVPDSCSSFVGVVVSVVDNQHLQVAGVKLGTLTCLQTIRFCGVRRIRHNLATSRRLACMVTATKSVNCCSGCQHQEASVNFWVVRTLALPERLRVALEVSEVAMQIQPLLMGLKQRLQNSLAACGNSFALQQHPRKHSVVPTPNRLLQVRPPVVLPLLLLLLLLQLLLLGRQAVLLRQEQ